MVQSAELLHYADALDLVGESILIASLPSSWGEECKEEVKVKVNFMNESLKMCLGFNNTQTCCEASGTVSELKCVDGVWHCVVSLQSSEAKTTQFFGKGKVKKDGGICILKLTTEYTDELSMLRSFFNKIGMCMSIVELGPDDETYEWKHILPNKFLMDQSKIPYDKLHSFCVSERVKILDRKSYYTKVLGSKTNQNDESNALSHMGTYVSFLEKNPYSNNDVFGYVSCDLENLRQTYQRASEFREFFEHAPCVMGAVQIDGSSMTMLYVNRAGVEYAGLSREEMYGRSPNVVKSFSTTSLDPFLELYRKSRENNQVLTSMIEIPGPDGIMHIMQITVSTLQYDQASGCSKHAYIMLDMTAQKQAELELERHKNLLENLVKVRTEELEDKQKTFGSIVANAPNIILRVNREGVIGYSNRDFVSDDSSSLTGKLLQSLVVEGAELKEKMDVLFKTNKSLTMDVKLLESDVWLHLSAGPIDETSAIVVATDITEMKELSEKLSHALATKSRFLANMSHEIRTPLSGIIGMSRILMEGGNLTMDQCECVATIQHCGETLLSVINDVLDYTKLEAIGQEMTIESNELSIHQCLEESLYTLLPAAQKKKLDLIIDIDPQLPDRILGDMMRLKQVVVNLINNAVKFTDKGYVHVAMTGVEIYGTDEWRYCCKIRDTGCGVPQESQGKLFKMFSQVDTSTTRKYGGTGIGLALAKRFLEMMNGEIWMDSTGVPGEGTTFSFTLTATLVPFTPVSSPSAMTSPHALANSTSIFIIKSENPLSSEVLCRRLMGKGLFNTQITGTSDVAKSFKEIHEFVSCGTRDKNVLVFCDVEQITPCCHYPLLDYPHIILVLMGYTRPKNHDTEYPSHEFIRKPVKHSSLVRLLKEAWVRFDTKLPPMMAPIRVPSLSKLQKEHYPINILVVEDNETNQKVVRRVFKHLGYNNVPIANHGMEALEMIEKNGIPDLILMDLQMPVLDGVQTTKILRKKYPSWPYIVSMTADAFPEDRKNCFEAGMNDFLTKPIRVEQVHNTIQKCFKIKQVRNIA